MYNEDVLTLAMNPEGRLQPEAQVTIQKLAQALAAANGSKAAPVIQRELAQAAEFALIQGTCDTTLKCLGHGAIRILPPPAPPSALPPLHSEHLALEGAPCTPVAALNSQQNGSVAPGDELTQTVPFPEDTVAAPTQADDSGICAGTLRDSQHPLVPLAAPTFADLVGTAPTQCNVEGCSVGLLCVACADAAWQPQVASRVPIQPEDRARFRPPAESSAALPFDAERATELFALSDDEAAPPTCASGPPAPPHAEGTVRTLLAAFEGGGALLRDAALGG